MSTDNNGASVNYTTKELVARVETKVDTVLQQMQSKAERSDLTALEKRVSNIETHGSPHLVQLQSDMISANKRIEGLELVKYAADVSKGNRKWIIGLVLSSATGWVAIALKLFNVI